MTRGLPALTISAAILVISSHARAETPHLLTLTDALKIAHAQKPALARAALRVEEARLDAAVPRAEWYPRFVVGAQISLTTVNQTSASNYPIRGVDISRIAGKSPVNSPNWQPYPSTFAGLGVGQEIFDFGRIAAAAAARDALVDVTSERARALLLDVDFAVEEAYFAVLAAKDVARAATDARDHAKLDRELADSAVKSGLRPPADLARADAEQARLEAGVAQANGGVLEARVVLAAAIGDPAADVDVAGVPPAAPDIGDLGGSIERALHDAPRLRELVAETKARDLEARAIAAESRPNVFLNGVFYSWAGGAPPDGGPEAFGAGLLPVVPNYSAGLTLSIPLWDPVVDARAKVAQIREREAQAALADERQEVIAEVRRAFVALDVAKSVLPSLDAAVVAAKTNEDQATARYKSGLGTSTELAEAEELRAEADVRRALGDFDVARARAALGRAIAEGVH